MHYLIKFLCLLIIFTLPYSSYLHDSLISSGRTWHSRMLEYFDLVFNIPCKARNVFLYFNFYLSLLKIEHTIIIFFRKISYLNSCWCDHLVYPDLHSLLISPIPCDCICVVYFKFLPNYYKNWVFSDLLSSLSPVLYELYLEKLRKKN